MRNIDFAGYMGCFILRDLVYSSREFKLRYDNYEVGLINLKHNIGDLTVLCLIEKMVDKIKIYHGHCIMCSILGVIRPSRKLFISMDREYFKRIELKIVSMAEEIKSYLSDEDMEHFDMYTYFLKEYNDYIVKYAKYDVKRFFKKCYEYYS